MKINKNLSISLLLIAAAIVAAIFIHATPCEGRHTLYQVSILDGLMKGDFDGKIKVRDIRKYGDFGIGTYDRLDGEAVGLDGVFYRIGADGAAIPVSGDLRSPFAMVTPFKYDSTYTVTANANYDALKSIIDGKLETKNIPYAIKVEGKFDRIKVRSVPAQAKPYPPLSEIVKTQPVFEYRDIEGTLVGFRLPDYMQGVNMPGYHMHFLSRDKKFGGHLLDCAVNAGSIKIDKIDQFVLALPESPSFNNLDLSPNARTVAAAERAER